MHVPGKIIRFLQFGLMAAAAGAAQPEGLHLTLEFAGRPLRLNAEIAATPAERAAGLMHRRELAAGQGMLFIYPRPEILRVWMKNMHIPLDVLFLDGSGRIAGLMPNLPPCRAEPCAIYTFEQPAQYMLEVNSGYIATHRLRIGDRIILPPMR